MGPSCLHQGSTACQDPTQTHCQAGYKGILARILHGPLREGDTAFIRAETMPAPEWFLCAGFPLRRKEGTISGSCFLLRISGHRNLALRPTRTSGVQRGPGLTAEGKGCRLGRGILFL